MLDELCDFLPPRPGVLVFDYHKQAAVIVLVPVKSNSCPSWSHQLLSHVGHLSFLDSGNDDMVAAKKSQQISDLSA